MMGVMRDVLPIFILLLMPSQAQASYEYAASCMPRYYSGEDVGCQLNIIGQAYSEITISTFSGSDTFYLPAGEAFQREFGNEFIPTLNDESKAIRIRSDNEVQVLVYKYRSGYNYDREVYMIPNQNRDSTTYYTSAYYQTGGLQCSYSTYKQFYLVSSVEDETTISVMQQDGTTYNLVLPEFGTFLQMTADAFNLLAMGTRIISNKPITVVAGNLCVYNYVGTTDYDTYASTIPDVASLGEEYIVPHIISDDLDNPAGYSIGVVATASDTSVLSDGEMRSLDQGETAIFEYPQKQSSSYVQCSKPCLVVQYAKSIFYQYGLFMQHVLPEQQFVTSALFTTVDSQSTPYLSLVVQGESPGDDIYLNGNSLGTLTWTAINGYASAELVITHGAHELVSTLGRPFAAYVYMQRMFGSTAFGYALLPSEAYRVTPAPETTEPTPETTESPGETTESPEETTEPPFETTEPPFETTKPPFETTEPPFETTEPPFETTKPPFETTEVPQTTESTPQSTPTTPRPSVNGTLPQHSVRVNGTAFAADGQDISPACAVAHLNSLTAKSKDMVLRVNAAIGESICLPTDDIRVVSSSVGTFNQFEKILMHVYHVLQVLGHHVPDAVESCAVEVADYLNDLAHWQRPIFPDEPGCSRMDVIPPYFNTTSTFWYCDNQHKEDISAIADNVLSYSSDVSETFVTGDGSNLDPGCTSAYLGEAASKTSAMAAHISEALAETTCGDVVRSVTHGQSFTAIGNQAYFQASFYYVPNHSASFAEFVECMQQVHTFSLLHANWYPGSQPGAPFLPVPPGCPALEHATDTLDDEGHRWECV